MGEAEKEPRVVISTFKWGPVLQPLKGNLNVEVRGLSGAVSRLSLYLQPNLLPWAGTALGFRLPRCTFAPFYMLCWGCSGYDSCHLSYCSQNGGNSFRDRYHHLNHTIRTGIIAFLRTIPIWYVLWFIWSLRSSSNAPRLESIDLCQLLAFVMRQLQGYDAPNEQQLW